MKKEILLVVNEQDEVVGTETREKCHEGGGILHRAVTVFIFNDEGKVLVAKRAKQKLLWPGYWETSCSTHVYENESYVEAAQRRLPQELGFSCKLKYIFKFVYQAKYKDVGSEHEVCAVLIGKYNGKVSPNEQEVSDYKWVSLDELRQDIDKNPDKYAPWLKIVMTKYYDLLRGSS